MIRLNQSIRIARPQQQVFAYLTDLTRIPQWQAEVVTSEVLTPGPVQVGTRFKETVKMGPWRALTECQVTELEPASLMAVSARSQQIHYQGRFRIEPAAGGSLVSIDGSAELQGSWKLLKPMMSSEFRKGIKAELEALKRELERS